MFKKKELQIAVMVTCSFGVLVETRTEVRTITARRKQSVAKIKKNNSLEVNEFSLQSNVTKRRGNGKSRNVEGDSGAHINNKHPSYPDEQQMALVCSCVTQLS